MKSYFFTASTVIHSSLIHINAQGEREWRGRELRAQENEAQCEEKSALS